MCTVQSIFDGMDHGADHGSWIMDHGSWIMVQVLIGGSCIIVQILVWIMDHG